MGRLLSGSVSAFGALSRRRDGAVAAEFALLAPLLFFIMLGAVEFGTVFLAYSAMQLGGTAAARNVAVNNPDPAGVLADVKTYLPPWVRNSVTVVVNQTAPGLPEFNLIQVQLQADAEDATPLPLYTRLIPWTLTADITMKQELPYVD